MIRPSKTILDRLII